MPDQIDGSTLDKTIRPNEFTKVTLAIKDDKQLSAHSTILATSSHTTNNEEGYGFPCDKCDKSFPNEKKAKDLHMQTEHNIKTLKATPGPVKRSTTITRPKAKGEVQTRASIKCSLCSFVMQECAKYD